MVDVMSAREYAEFAGRPVEEIEIMISEADVDGISGDTIDSASFTFHNWSPKAEERCREILGRARAQGQEGE